MGKQTQTEKGSFTSHAEQTVRHYSRIAGYKGEPDYEADITDLLTDLRHFCAQAGLNFDALFEASRCHYEAERKEQNSE